MPPGRHALDKAGADRIDDGGNTLGTVRATCSNVGDTSVAGGDALLGATSTENGNFEVDDHQRTSITGLYAAGDVVTDLHQLSVAFGHAAVAATDIHNRLPPNPR